MSLAEVYSAGCQSKQRFATPALAHKVFNRRPRAKLEVYRCNFCGGWHHGTANR